MQRKSFLEGDAERNLQIMREDGNQKRSSCKNAVGTLNVACQLQMVQVDRTGRLFNITFAAATRPGWVGGGRGQPNRGMTPRHTAHHSAPQRSALHRSAHRRTATAAQWQSQALIRSAGQSSPAQARAVETRSTKQLQTALRERWSRLVDATERGKHPFRRFAYNF
mgnify:CR=1 FL=1